MVSFELSGYSQAPSIERGAHRLVGPDYLQSPEKTQFDLAVAELLFPLTRQATRLTEKAIYGEYAADHYFIQEREGLHGQLINVPKIRTMRQPAEGEVPDIDRYSARIVNSRALMARIIGLDELPQWELVRKGEMSAVGPRPLLRSCKDRFSALAEEGGVSTERVEEWREFLDEVRPGLFGKSQALRHKRKVNEYTVSASIKIITADLDYKRRASVPHDIKAIACSMGVTLFEGLKSIKR